MTDKPIQPDSYSWSYRVVKYENGQYGLHEVYYGEKGEVDGWTENELGSYDSLEELREALVDMLHDVDHYPVLEESELGPTLNERVRRATDKPPTEDDRD